MRGEIGSDGPVYHEYYRSINSNDLLNLEFEPLYTLLTLIFSYFFPYYIFQFFIVGFLCFSVIKLFGIKSSWITIISALTLIIIENIGIQRQILSIAFIILSLSYIHSSRLKFNFFILFAVLSHFSAIIFIIGFIITRMNFSIKILFIIASVLFGAYFINFISSSSIPLISSKLTAYSFDNFGFISSNEEYIVGIASRILLLVFSIYAFKKIYAKNEKNKVIYVELFLYAVIIYILLGMFMPVIATRGTLIFQFLLLNWLALNFKNGLLYILPLFLTLLLKIPRLLIALEPYEFHEFIF
jgi:hypothetical protein